MTSQAPNATMGGNGTPGDPPPGSRANQSAIPPPTSSSNFGSGSGGFADFSSYSQPNSQYSQYTPNSSGPGTLARVSSATVENPSPTTDAAPDGQQQYDRFGHGHYFSKKTFHKPTYCHHCTDMLWGIIGQGFICEGTSVQFQLKHIQISLLK